MSQPSFAVVTDSSAHLISPEWLHAPELGFVPLPVQIGTEIYHESSTLRLRDFFGALQQQLPITLLPPNPSEFVRIYRHFQSVGLPILSIHATETFTPVLPVVEQLIHHQNAPVSILDVGCISLGLGFLVQQAVQMARQQVPIEQALRQLRMLSRGIYGLFLTRDFATLQRQNYISAINASLGEMLKIQALVLLADGQIKVTEKVATPQSGYEKITEFLSEFDNISAIGVVKSYTEPDESSAHLIDSIRTVLPNLTIPSAFYRPSLGLQIGQPALGVLVATL
jgi:DegV family protein with EDD domain